MCFPYPAVPGKNSPFEWISISPGTISMFSLHCQKNTSRRFTLLTLQWSPAASYALVRLSKRLNGSTTTSTRLGAPLPMERTANEPEKYTVIANLIKVPQSLQSCRLHNTYYIPSPFAYISLASNRVEHELLLSHPRHSSPTQVTWPEPEELKHKRL